MNVGLSLPTKKEVDDVTSTIEQRTTRIMAFAGIMLIGLLLVVWFFFVSSLPDIVKTTILVAAVATLFMYCEHLASLVDMVFSKTDRTGTTPWAPSPDSFSSSTPLSPEELKQRKMDREWMDVARIFGSPHLEYPGYTGPLRPGMYKCKRFLLDKSTPRGVSGSAPWCWMDIEIRNRENTEWDLTSSVAPSGGAAVAGWLLPGLGKEKSIGNEHVPRPGTPFLIIPQNGTYWNHWSRDWIVRGWGPVSSHPGKVFVKKNRHRKTSLTQFEIILEFAYQPVHSASYSEEYLITMNHVDTIKE